MRVAITFFIIFFSSRIVLADSTTTYTTNTVRYVQLNDFERKALNYHSLDTTLDGFQRFNPILSDGLPRIYLGNLGTAYQSLLFEITTTIGFDPGRHAFDRYLTRPEAIRFYRAQSPYTRLLYIWNRKKEQVFKFTFAQNITPRLNYAINFGRLVSEGNYQRQKSDHLTMDGSIWYHSKNQRYTILGGYISNNLKIQENGGIKNDSIFSVPSSLQTEFEPVYLNHAGNRIVTSHLFYKQSYSFGNKDTFEVDTLVLPVVQPRHRFSHGLTYEKNRFSYIESELDQQVYPFIFVDSFSTQDNFRVNQLKNDFDYDYFSKNNLSKVITLSHINLGVTHNTITIEDFNLDTTLDQLTFRSGIGFSIANKHELQYHYKQIVSGDYENNNHSHILLRFQLKEKVSHLEITSDFIRTAPDWRSSRFHSNHYWWDTNFKTIQKSNYAIGFLHKPFYLSLKLFYTQIKGMIYYNDASFPLQLGEQATIYGLVLNKNFTFWKFHLDNIICTQNTSHEEVVRLPYLYTYNSFYFESSFFKKALLLRAGFDNRYYTSFFGYDYNPALAQFTLENNHSFGDYPIVDFFVTAKVKRALLMLKIDHLNDKWIKSGYYAIPRYPLPERVFKIGVSWSFYD